MVLPLLPELCASAVVASSAMLSETRISVSTTTFHVLKMIYGPLSYLRAVQAKQKRLYTSHPHGRWTQTRSQQPSTG